MIRTIFLNPIKAKDFDDEDSARVPADVTAVVYPSGQKTLG
jgi:hypothetical protein